MHAPRPSGPRPHTSRRRSLVYLIALSLSLAAVNLPITPAAAASVGGGSNGKPSLPNTLVLPATPITASAGSVGYLPGSWNVTPGGAFGYSIPLDVPQGRAGVQPSLQLQYDSGNGNGSLGVGWAISGASSMITRCDGSMSTDGAISGIHFDSSDHLCLDGQELVQLDKVPNGPPPLSGDFRTEDDSFARITGTATAATAAMGFDQFEVRTKDGHIRTYLPHAAVRVTSGVGWKPGPVTGNEVQTTPRTVWMLASETDRSGNEMDYSWTNTTGPDGNEFLIHRIDYTSHTTASEVLDSHRYVEFTYEDRPDTSFRYIAGVRYVATKRLKTISMYAPNPGATSLAWQYNLVYATSYSGHSLLISVAKCGPSGGCLRSKKFGWQSPTSGIPKFTATDLGALAGFTTGQSRSPFAQVVDLNGDGADDLLWTLGGTGDADSPYRARLAVKNPSTGVITPLSDDVTINGVSADWPANADLTKSRLMDLKGTGTATVAASYSDAGGAKTKLLYWDTGSKTFADTGIAINGSSNTVMADLNGDGRPDYVTDDGTGNGVKLYTVRLNNGNGFDAPVTSLYPSGTAAATCGAPRVTDADGDGRADLVGPGYLAGACTAAPQILHLDPSGMPVVHDESTTVAGTVYYDALPQISGYKVVTGDFNGDRLDDYLLVPNKIDPNTNTWDRPAALLWNTGAGLAADSHIPSIPHDKFADVRPADVNGDGLTDLVAFTDGATTVMRSNGDGTFTSGDIAADGGTSDPAIGRGTSVVGDFTGDGRPDVARVTSGHLQLLTQAVSYPDLMQTVTDQGTAWAAQTVTYSTAWTDHPEKMGNYTCSYPVRCIRRGLFVVREVASRDHLVDPGTLAGAYVLQYAFEDPDFDVRGRGFLGFGTMRVWDPQRPSETTYDFHQHHDVVDGVYYPYVERPVSVTTATPVDGAGGIVRKPGPVLTRVVKTTSTYELRHLNNGHSFTVYPKTDVTKEWEQSATVTLGALSSATAATHITGIAEPANALRRTDNSYTYDDYGNRTDSTSAVTSGTKLVVHTDYDNRVSDWLISLPVHQTATSSTVANQPGPVTRTSDSEYDALGRLTASWTEKGNASADVTTVTTYVINDFGTLDAVRTAADGVPDRVTHLEYAPSFPGEPNEYIFPSQTWSDHDVAAYRPSHWSAIQPAYGLSVASEDSNGVQTTTSYDDLGRPVKSTADGQDPATMIYSNRPDSYGGTNGTVAQATAGTAPQMPQLTSTTTDALGRIIASSSTGFNGQAVVSSTKYDQFGRVASQTAPAPGGTTTYSYDSLDRVVATTLPDGSVAKNAHTFFTTTATSPGGNEVDTTYNVDHQVVSTVQVNGAAKITTKYEYGPFGLLSTVIDDKGGQTSYGYDVRGRQVKIDDLDTGRTTDSYYGTGDLRTETHVATGHTTTFGYDDLGRNTSHVDEDGTTTFTYDTAPNGIGKLASTLSADGIGTRYSYDTAGRQIQVAYSDPGTSSEYTVDQTFSATGRLATTAFPSVPGRDRFTIAYGYNGFGIANSVNDVTGGGSKNLWSVQSRMPNQALQTAKLGGSTETMSYDSPSGRLHNINVGTAGGPSVDLTYGYQADGYVSARTESVTARSETFGYDSLGELTSWNLTNGNAGQVSTGYTYDTIGDLTSITRNGSLAETHTYGSPYGNQPHTLTGVAIAGAGTAGMTTLAYDGQGRQTSAGGRTATYTAANLPKSVTTGGVTTTFAYDAFGQRVRKTSPGGSTFTVPGRYEHRVSGNAVTDVFFVTGTDGPVGQVVYTGNATKTEYAVRDQLGSVIATLDANGAVLGRMYYEPFGGRTKPDGTPLASVSGDVVNGFTGDEHDDELGLVNMSGRVYDPVQHTFLSADPRHAPAANPYTYVHNSPLNYTDPTGYVECDASCQWQQDEAGSSAAEFGQESEAYDDGGLRGLENYDNGALNRAEGEYDRHVVTEEKLELEQMQADLMKSDGSGYDSGDAGNVGSSASGDPSVDEAATPGDASATSNPDSADTPAVEGTWDPAAAAAVAIAVAMGVPLPLAVDLAKAGQGISDILQGCASDPASCQESAQAQVAAAPSTGPAADVSGTSSGTEETMLGIWESQVAYDQESVANWTTDMQRMLAMGPLVDENGVPETADFDRRVAGVQEGLSQAQDMLANANAHVGYWQTEVAKIKGGKK